ncbi:RNA polymerase sigma-I factor [Desulfotruncus alcoholivorax]|uniref:RNA polymerase sigma-I factor n=1 Tax=Desulfotruncus alcoholivorax TaxID=265477 RepID=UPI0006885E83|nr:RNA polymerase sigma-I factor [Desulfotruncus alcoholivorax]
MNDSTALNLINSAQKGDRLAREELIKQYKPFIQKASFNVCKRPLSWENDDELSIALIAFNDAINSYNPDKGASFFNFARGLISQRLIDYFRKEARHQHQPLSGFNAEEEMEISLVECARDRENHQLQTEQEELAETMLELDRRLGEFGTSLDELADICPRHRDAREKLVRVARVLCSDLNLVDTLRKNKRLSAKELARAAKVSKRILENGRKYIIALAVIMTEERFSALKHFAGLDE